MRESSAYAIWPDGETSWSITLDAVDVLEEALVRHQFGLLIVDPMQSFLGADVNAHRSNETRPVLDGLGRLAAKHNLAVLLLRHQSKSSSTSRAIYRV